MIEDDIYKAARSLDTNDINMLYSIYVYRVMSFKLIMKYIYSDESKSETSNYYLTRRRINKFVTEGLIELVDKAEDAYCLTKFGFQALRDAVLLNRIDDKPFYELARASELKVNPSVVKHQLYTADFLLAFTPLEKTVLEDYYSLISKVYIAGITTIEGRRYDYIFQDYTDRRLNDLSLLIRFNNCHYHMKSNNGESFPLVLVANSEESIYNLRGIDQSAGDADTLCLTTGNLRWELLPQMLLNINGT